MSDRLAHAIAYCSERAKSAPRYKPHNLYKPGFVYLIQCGAFYKVGTAIVLKHRLATLQVGNPYELTMVKYWRTNHTLRLERRLHRVLRHYSHRGEWFKLPAPVVARLMQFKP